MPNDILKARVQQAEEHQGDTSSKLDVMIKQNDESNPNENLEALISQNDENNDKVVKKIDELKPKKNANIENMSNFISGFFEQMIGADGKDGKDGKSIKGENGNNGKDGRNGKDGKNGLNGRNGKDGLNGLNGKDGKNGIDGRNGEPGKSGKDVDIKELLKMTLKSIKGLKKDDRISYNDLKDTPQIFRSPGNLGAVSGMSNTTVSNDLGLNFVDDETPDGELNGANKEFTISNIPVINSLKLYRNGQRLKVTEDYTLSGKTITLIIAPESDEILLVDFRF